MTNRLPDIFDPERGGAIPDGLIGAELIRFGGAELKCSVEGGGLVIDYLPKDKSEQRRVVFAFNELGMWVRAQTEAS